MSRHRVRLPSTGEIVTIEHRPDRGAWYLDLKRKGKRHRPRLASSRSRAIAAADRYVLELRSRVPTGPTLLRVAAQMLLHKSKTGRRPGTTKAMMSHLRRHVFPALGKSTSVDQIDAQMLRDLMFGLIDADINFKTANRIHTTVRQLFEFAQDRGYCEMPDMPKRFPESATDNAHVWTVMEPADLKKLLEHMDAEIRPAVVYLANTGIRVSSALATRRSWIDLDAGVVHYPAASVKQRRPFVQTLNQAATAALRVAMSRSEGEEVFPFGYWLVRYRFKSSCRALGVPDFQIKDLRHSMVSNLLAAGNPIHVVRELMGHSSIHVTALYAHAQDAAKRAAVASVAVDADLPVPPNATRRATKRRNAARTRKPAGGKPAGSRSVTPVGHIGLEPIANGLRIHCSTD